MGAERQEILIIGAGVSGLTLAQACRKENIPFRIFERDESPTSRSAGWGLTLNWALPTFRAILPEDICKCLPETYVNREAVDAGEKGSFTFFNLCTGETKWKVPTAERIRVSRERLRKLLLSGLDVEWAKTLTDIVNDGTVVTASFSDGTTASGGFLVACDGTHSVVRRLVYPENFKNYQLPIRLLGAGVRYGESQMSAMKMLDPYFLQGSDSKTDAFLYFSFLEAPGDPDSPTNEENGERVYRCQVMISWPYRENFFGRADPTEVPNTERGMRMWMKALSAEWAEPFRSVVQNIPQDAEIKPVQLTDWLPQRCSGSDYGGRVALVGDAAHAMVMYRGEGANHAIVDVAALLEKLRPLYTADGVCTADGEQFANAVQAYEDEMIERTELAVLASRQACLDAHDYKRLNETSPLVRRRLMRADLEAAQRS